MKNKKFIYRVAGDKVMGWQIRILQGTKFAHSKLFSDSVYGGNRKALAAAIKYRDRYLQKLPAKVRNCVQFVKQSKGKSWGKNLHYINRERSGSPGHYYKAWIGVYFNREQGVQVKKAFSTRRYGYRKAKALAKRFRDKNHIDIDKYGKAID